jgi:hypothetical protein
MNANDQQVRLKFSNLNGFPIRVYSRDSRASTFEPHLRVAAVVCEGWVISVIRS